MSENKKISVVLVDDSGVIRGVLSRILSAESNMEVVGSVANGQIAISEARTKKPDVMLLDVEMPVMDGLSALPEILKASPHTKVIMCSSLTAKGADTTIRALSLGAVECVVKPSAADAGPNSVFKRTLISLITGLGEKALKRVPRIAARDKGDVAKDAAPAKALKSFTLKKDSGVYTGVPNILAIGSSTGGPQALFTALKDIGTLKVPIVITQHMPATFTKILAEHIEQKTGIPSQEGADGMVIKAGQVYVAPGGQHMLLEKKGLEVRLKLDDGPAENFCKPSVDPMLRSVIEIYGRKALCVILTGMGNDGLPSARSLAEIGGRIIAQDEQTSIVWGMPGAVAMDGICSEVLPLNKIGTFVRGVFT